MTVQKSSKPADAEKRPRGRPKTFKAEFVDQARKFYALGATDYELANFFDVDTRTIYRWKNTHDDFCQAVVVGKEKADDRVERALYNRAVAYPWLGLRCETRRSRVALLI
ncbi:hypothetical protein G6M50_34575 [Agrobacterium rhizogenes]|nr:hypothetical protein [Rhizobium rhizogenes]NTJ82917.1 hypothetical protein [Rhizobium rhizogenes]